MTRQAWRRVWFQVHKWIGLILAILIVPLTLSGAALVWHDALDRVANPARYAVSGSSTLPPGRYVEAARGVLKPGDRIATLAMPHGSGPVVLSAAPAPGRPMPGPPPRTMVYLDPPNGRILDVASNRTGLVRFVHVLHGSLQVPEIGRTIVGWIGVAMMVSSFSGLWLWWPMVGRWVRGLRWRRHRDVDTNLHYLIGFWVSLPLFVLSLTGAWIAFPAFVGMLGGAPPRGDGMRGAARAAPVAAAAQPIARVVASAERTMPGTLRMLSWPTEKSADWTVTIDRDGAPTQVKVADDSGDAVAAPARERGGLARLMRRIHDGDGMGPVWQTIIFLAGLMPSVLAVTGIVMWLRMRRRRAGRRTRRTA